MRLGCIQLEAIAEMLLSSYFGPFQVFSGLVGKDGHEQPSGALAAPADPAGALWEVDQFGGVCH